MDNKETCKVSVSGTGQWGSFHPHRCKKQPWKDGYCKVHHPDSEKIRNEQARKRWNDKWENSIESRYSRLSKACSEALAEMNIGNYIKAYTIIEDAMK